MTTASDRGAVQALLKRRRAALDPADLGIEVAAGSGRRAAGPPQEAIDDHLVWARGTYQAIESGRNGNVPADRLEAIARLLRLTEHEWEMLWAVLRGEGVPYPLYASAGQEVPGEWLEALHSISAPAYINDRSWDVIAHNDALPAIFPGGRVPENTMRWMWLSDLARGRPGSGITPTLTDWEHRWAPTFAPQLRAAVAALPHDKTLAQIEADVRADVRAGPIYERAGDVYVHPDGAIRPYHHPIEGPGWLRLCTAEPLAAPRAHLMIALWSPGPEPVRRPKLRSLSAPGCAQQGQRSSAP